MLSGCGASTETGDPTGTSDDGADMIQDATSLTFNIQGDPILFSAGHPAQGTISAVKDMALGKGAFDVQGSLLELTTPEQAAFWVTERGIVSDLEDTVGLVLWYAPKGTGNWNLIAYHTSTTRATDLYMPVDGPCLTGLSPGTAIPVSKLVYADNKHSYGEGWTGFGPKTMRKATVDRETGRLTFEAITPVWIGRDPVTGSKRSGKKFDFYPGTAVCTDLEPDADYAAMAVPLGTWGSLEGKYDYTIATP
jgi:hypothetical protein